MVCAKLLISRGGGIATEPKQGTCQQFHACQKLWPKVPISYVEVEVPSVRRDRRLLKHHLLCYVYVSYICHSNNSYIVLPRPPPLSIDMIIIKRNVTIICQKK